VAEVLLECFIAEHIAGSAATDSAVSTAMTGTNGDVPGAGSHGIPPVVRIDTQLLAQVRKCPCFRPAE